MQEYAHYSAEATCAHGYVGDKVIEILRRERSVERILDAGCGNGSLAARIAAEGYSVSAFDSSSSGVLQGRQAYPKVHFEQASVYDDLLALFGSPFDACVSTEVIEHLYDPRTFVRRVHEALRPGGLFIVSTPYHGYFKNLALAVTGKMDAHFSALWDGGHVKFFSRSTLTALLEEAEFEVTGFWGAGRLPLLWKSMIVVARKGSMVGHLREVGMAYGESAATPPAACHGSST